MKSQTNLTLEKKKKAWQPPFMEDQSHLTLGEKKSQNPAVPSSGGRQECVCA